MHLPPGSLHRLALLTLHLSLPWLQPDTQRTPNFNRPRGTSLNTRARGSVLTPKDMCVSRGWDKAKSPYQPLRNPVYALPSHVVGPLQDELCVPGILTPSGRDGRQRAVLAR